jgi:hypothetical protein
MRSGVRAAVVAMAVLGGGSVWAACPPRHRHDCVDLNLAPQVSQDIIAAEPLVTAPKNAPVAAPNSPYTGPTIGLTPQVRRAPEIGYRWAIN